MAKSGILDSEILRARIMQAGYNGLTEEEIRRIYIEETGKKPPAHITAHIPRLLNKE